MSSAAATTDKRRSERVSLDISAVVRVKESKTAFWKETTELVSLSRSGAGFYLEKQCEVGRLVSLMVPMPKHFRCYDHDKELYRVWGLVQHCSRVSGEGDAAFHVGVAFAGKNPPPSYTENPLHSYRIAGMNEDGTWRIVEAKTSFVVRRHPRYWLALEVMLAAHDSDLNLISDDQAKTENISQSGAALFSDLNVDVGDSVNFNSIEHNFSAQAIVRNRQTSESDLPRLHLEFINENFPIEQLKLPNERDILDEDEIAG
jgi:c-di-GMP-binding flagellar brake protein YcgR